MTPYETIAALAERELDLVRAGQLEELPVLHGRRDAVMALLPPQPPSGARIALERAAAAQAQVTATLDARMRAVADELTRVGRGQTAMRGYKPRQSTRTRFSYSG